MSEYQPKDEIQARLKELSDELYELCNTTGRSFLLTVSMEEEEDRWDVMVSYCNPQKILQLAVAEKVMQLEEDDLMFLMALLGEAE